MLKSLELLGFKSFADRTHFDFPAGITVVVGPNGSGKSNVVDAMKWVLGEQSAKSLRGKKASDVIFGGSSGMSGRRPMGAAEVTLVFDNTDKRLSIETDEVRITRRVYRGTDERSEGEYLINNQICKLNDIRELLLGTGLGAYSIIEQGRVDYLLQSSPQERRLLFEEAAGISRFRKRKQETLKKLETCEQNLLRLSDIVTERHRRLTQLQSQADRAVQFREYNTRLQELRFQAAAMDYTTMSEELDKVREEMDRFQGEHDDCQEMLDEVEDKLQQYENGTTEFEVRIREINERVTANRLAIVSAASVIEFQTRRSEELDQTQNSVRQRIAEMRQRTTEISQSHQAALAELEQAKTHREQVVGTLGAARVLLEEANQLCEAVRLEKEQCREQSIALMRKITAMENELASLARQEENLATQIRHSDARGVILDKDLNALLETGRTLDAQQAELEALKKRCEEDRSLAREELEVCKRIWNDAKSNLAELRQRHSEMGGRISTLQGLQERHEGLSQGVCYLLTEAKRADSPFRDIDGLVADMIQVEIKATSVLEVALGERAQYLVVAPHSPLRELLRRNPQGLPGRVGFLWMEDFLPATTEEPRRMGPPVWLTNQLEKRPGVIGRADQFVQCEEMYLPLFRFLLGETWIVQNLDTAFRLQEEMLAESEPWTLVPALSGYDEWNGNIQPRIHFVTLGGERLDADGTLCIGPQHTSSGLILRPNELRTLGPQWKLLVEEIQRCEEEGNKAEQKRLSQESLVKRFEQESLDADRQLREHEKKATATRERITQMEQRQVEWTQLREESERQMVEIQSRRERLGLEKSRLDVEASQLEGKLSDLDARLAACETARREKSQTVTQNEVRLAKSEERLDGLATSIRQYENEVQGQRRTLDEQRAQLREADIAQMESQRLLLQNESKIALLYSQKEQISSGLGDLQRERDAMKKERSEQNAAANRLRKKIQKLADAISARQVTVGKLEQERQQILTRLSEEFQIEPETFLTRLENPTDEEQEEHTEVQREITELREQIQRLGNINSEALAELDEQERQYDEISVRYEDCRESRDEILQIIDRMNEITRRQFLKTYERIGEYFYHIFRDLFGGGNAKLVMEEGVDPLESGIEIEVQPPGKDLRSLSLMSGGEKAMTCIALLFALFKNSPSQFCILDEVDAPLDEVNTGRLTGILQQFLEHAQFIMVSHSKKTMAAANTIYGITMQDSGVSKQVSYRFEEVNDDGKLEELGIHVFPSETQHTETEKELL